MKPFLFASVAAAAAFVFMGLQTGMFGPNRKSLDDETVDEPVKVVKKEAPKRARFPDDLAPAARAKPVPAAAEFTPGNRAHKLVYLKVNGALHDWQADADGYSEEWVATNVEETELAVIVGSHSKRMIQRVHFQNGPPVDRNQWELEASVVEAKTGRVLAHRSFISQPRAIRSMEAYELTALGKPVQYLTVYNWVADQAKNGFSPQVEQPPLITVVERQ